MKKTDMQQPMKMTHDQMQTKTKQEHDMNEAMPEMDMDMDDMDMTMPGGGHMHMSNFKQKFWVSLVAAIPVFILSPFMGMHLPFQASFPGSDWVVLLLATFLYVYGGEPFLSGAKAELKDKNPAMMTLVAMGISVAYLYSLYAFAANHFLGLHVMDFFWELASLIVIMLLGHWIEMNAVMSAGDVLEKMAQLLPGSAHVQNAAGKLEEVPLAKLQKGQLVQVKAGEKIPADGIITAGQSTVNESLVTGEAKAVAKAAGDKLIGGAVNGDGTLTVKITGTGESGYLAQVGKLVSQAQTEKSKAETLADKVSKWLFYAALSVGILAFFVWLALDGMSTGLARMVTVLVIACPHALGLAIPLVVARSTSLAAANGLLIQNRQAIEASKQVDTVLMDKTGTLTAGKFKVNTVLPLDGIKADQVLALAASLEKTSSHPLAAGILTAAKEKQLPLTAAKNVQALQGVGMRGKIGDQSYSLVTAAYLDQQHIAFDQDQFQQLAAAGNSLSYLLQGQRLLGLIAQGDQLKPHAKALIADLKARGLTPVMLTGDNEPAAMETARLLGGLTVKANLLPEDKAKIVRSYQAAGHHVMMVGDGVNDAPALATADVGIAIGAGTDVAIDSADVILVKSDPRDILHFLNLAKATNRKMVQNLWWGAGYNILAIPLAAGVLAGIGIILSPAVGAVVMSFSTVIVAVNAMSLKLK